MNAMKPIPGQMVKTDPREIRNAAGGYTREVSDRDRLERFLILGTDGGTFYVGEKDLTTQNLSAIDRIVRESPAMAADVCRAVSVSGRAYRNTPAVYVAARLICDCDEAMKPKAKRLVNEVCRTSTHIFEFCVFIEVFGGWGHAKCDAVRTWYESKTRDSLKYQAVKYRGGRHGWTHRDVLRTVHPVGLDDRVADFMLGKEVPRWGLPGDIIDGLNYMKQAKSLEDVITILESYPQLPWETIPTEYLNSPVVWMALFYNGQLRGQALLRNMRRMEAVGCFSDSVFDSVFAKDVAEELTRKDSIRNARLHPVQYLNAMGACGYLNDRRVMWDPRSTIPIALEEGLYAAFETAQSAERCLLAVDVSGSMSWEGPAGLKRVSCAQAAAVMAMVTARTSPRSMVRGFTQDFVDLGITADTPLWDAFEKVQVFNFGCTDCSQPIRWALDHRAEVDKFVIYTDNETWAGRDHVPDLLARYRERTGIPAKLVVVGMTATRNTVGDPEDCGTLDVVGFDTSTPQIIANF
jgi:60 kDa SS-A/Ro ribonucleoprotein